MRQDEERGLKCVLRILRVAERPPTDAQHHRPVPMHQLFERRLRVVASRRDEPVQKWPVRQSAERPLAEQTADLPEPRAR